MRKELQNQQAGEKPGSRVRQLKKIESDGRHKKNQGFGSAFFVADPDPGKNLHADLDPDPGGIRGEKGKNEILFF